jgi:hypothetical protein
MPGTTHFRKFPLGEILSIEIRGNYSGDNEKGWAKDGQEIM